MGTLKHYRRVVQKLKGQPFGLKQVAADLENILTSAAAGGQPANCVWPRERPCPWENAL